METKAKLSVIIPIYNVEPYIRQCLDSIVGQTYRNLEIILIDDGSPDNCGAICDEYADRDERVRVLHKKNGGVQAARNDGIDIAAGEWITFVDPDDWCELDYYEQLFKAMGDEQVDVFISGGSIMEYGDKSRIVRGFKQTVIYTKHEEIGVLTAKVLAPECGVNEKMGSRGNGTVWDKIYNTAFIRRYDLRFDPACKTFDDLWFNFQMFDRAERVGGCSYIGYHYRIVTVSISKGPDTQKINKNYVVINKLYAYMEYREPNDMISQALRALCLVLIGDACVYGYFHPENREPYKKVAEEVKAMKAWPYFHEAIYHNDCRYLSKKQIVLRYLLRLPWAWPLKLAYTVRRKI